MSAFIVSDAHLDYLLTAGLKYGQRYGLTWLAPEEEPAIAEAEGPTREAGEPWGPGWVPMLRRRQRSLTHETAEQVGLILAAENRRSVNHRYAEEEIEDLYTFVPYSGRIDPVTVLKSIACYEYQACEHEGWKESEAREFCKALRSAAIHELAGWDAAPWGIDTNPARSRRRGAR